VVGEEGVDRPEHAARAIASIGITSRRMSASS
jgi:hypothetical protein